MGTQSLRSRRARQTARSLKLRRVTTVVGSATVVAVLAVAGYSFQRGTNAAPTETVSRPLGSSTTARPPQSVIDRINTEHPPRPLNHERPLGVWVGGDSFAGHIGPTLGEQLTDSGIVAVTVDFKVGSGLHDNGRRNWSTRIPEQMAKHDPDVAIFMIGANDASIVSSNTDAWAPKYRSRVRAQMETLSGDSDRTVYWIGPPPMKSGQLERGAKALSELMADEATRHDNVVFIDAYTMFADNEGNYTNRIDIPTLQKKRVLVRISDGVHFTNDGADWLAYRLALLLDEQWDITKQSGGKPIRISIESNGGSVPGYTPRTTASYRATTTTLPGNTTTIGNTTTSSGTTPTTVASSTSTTSTSNAPPTTSAPPTTATIGP